MVVSNYSLSFSLFFFYCYFLKIRFDFVQSWLATLTIDNITIFFFLTRPQKPGCSLFLALYEICMGPLMACNAGGFCVCVAADCRSALLSTFLSLANTAGLMS